MKTINPITGKLNEKPPKAVFGTYEWASETVNIINGCAHNCKYCYSKAMAIRFKRKTRNNWKDEQIRNNGSLNYSKKVDGTIMFPSSHDIHPCHLDYHIEFINRLLERGNKLLIVSKPHLQSIKAICENFINYKTRILFRFTIGSSNSDTLKFWEPGAPTFNERFSSLKVAYRYGFKTSISCEPMLDNDVDLVIRKVYPYVTDSIWIGKANFLIKRLRTNGEGDRNTMKKAYQLIEWQCGKNIHKLYNKYKNDRKIKWKESIKIIVGIRIPNQRGLDI